MQTKIRTRVSPHLPVGETHVAAFAAVAGPVPWLAWRHRVVAVTDKSVHLFTAALWRVCEPKKLIATLPHGTGLSSERDFFYEKVYFGAERLWVLPAHQKFLREAIAASRAFDR